LGCPLYVGIDFWGCNNKLTNLHFHPEYVGKSFYCMNNNGILKRPDRMILGGDLNQAIPNK